MKKVQGRAGDEEFGRNLCKMYKKNKSMLWKELQKERGTGWAVVEMK